MQISNVYSIYDKVAEVFNRPFFDHNNATAIRSFEKSAKEQEHKDDYVLYHIGVFDDTTGEIQPCDNPVKLITGIEVTAEVNQVPVQLQQQAS